METKDERTVFSALNLVSHLNEDFFQLHECILYLSFEHKHEIKNLF